VDRAWWDKLVAACPEATVFQSSAWAAYLRSLAHDPWFLWSFDRAGQPAAALLVQRTGGTDRSLIGRFLRASHERWTWRHGPLAGPGSADELPALIVHADGEARQRRVAFERVTPPLERGRESVEAVLAQRGWTRTRQATILVDLRPPEEALWRALRPAARKALAKCERDGLKVRRLEPDAPLDDYLDVLRETRTRLGFGLPPHYPSEAMRRAFQGTSAVCEVFVAERNGRVLGGLGVIGFGPTVIEIASAQSGLALAEKLYTNDAIKWAVIRWAREAGFRWYDLGGIDPEPADAKAAAIRQFKEKWGGAIVEFGAFAGPA
jgi:hypothetical protein